MEANSTQTSWHGTGTVEKRDGKNMSAHPGRMDNRVIKRKVLITGLSCAALFVALLCAVMVLDYQSGLRILAMVGASHIAGRVAFIATGFEFGFQTPTILLVIILYNTVMVLLIFWLFVSLPEHVQKLKFLTNLHQKVWRKKQIRSGWNMMSIAFFIWIPLPVTGALIGSLIAYFEGFTIRQTLCIALPAMWFGVISWTVAYDELFHLLRSIHPGITTVVTLSFLLLPIIVNVIGKKTQTHNTRS